jgi:alpha-tubulin suppressor-like RCC1 family protein
VYCWGYNQFGQVGDGTFGNNRLLPVAVQGPGGQGTLTDVVALGPFPLADRMCAVKADGSVFCWGVQPLGDGTQSNSPTPVQVLAPGEFLRAEQAP